MSGAFIQNASSCDCVFFLNVDMHAFRTKSQTFEGVVGEFIEWGEKTFPSTKQSFHSLRVAFNAILKRHGKEAEDSSLVHIRTFKPSTKSDVWNYMYFTKKSDGSIEKNGVTCVICGARLKFRGNSTGGLLAHLATHPSEKEAHDRQEMKSERSTLERWVASQRPLSKGRKEEIDSAILRFIVLGMQPFSVVSNDAFKALLTLLEPRYEIPSRTTMSQVRLHDLFMQTVEKTWAEKKDTIVGCSLTLDGWSSRSDVHYLGITAHYIDENWNFMSLPLDLVPLSHSTGVNIEKTISDVLEIRNLDANRIVAVTSDAGADVRKGCKLFGNPHYLCILHGLHNAMHAALEKSGMNEVMKRLKDIVSTFNCSTKLWACLEKAERAGGIDRPKKLKQSIETRWGSHYDMVERFLQIQKYVNIALVEGGHACKALCADEVMQLEVFKEESQIIRKLTSSLQSQSEVLFPRAVCSLHALKEKLLHRKEILSSDARDGRRKEIADTFLQELLAAFQSTIHIQEVVEFPTPLTLAISFMDPRYRDVIMKYHGVDSLKKVKEMVGTCVEHFHQDDESDCIRVEKEHMGEEAIAEKSEMMELDDLMFGGVVDSGKESSQDEWERYQQLPSCERWKDPLQWWRSREYELPTLSKAARVLLCAMPTSAPCESFFSIVGRIQDYRRCSLSPIVLKELVLLNRWLKLEKKS